MKMKGGVREAPARNRLQLPFSTKVFTVLALLSSISGLLYSRYATTGLVRSVLKRHAYPLASRVNDLPKLYSPRVVYMTAGVAAHRTIQHIHIDSSSILDNSTLESDDPDTIEGCAPRDWLTASHPYCNGMHELGNVGEMILRNGTTHRLQGLVRIYENGGRRMGGELWLPNDDVAVVYKVLRLRPNKPFNINRLLWRSRVEALVMEKLDSAVDMYCFCGTSSVSELGDGGQLYEVLHRRAKEGSITPLEKLEYAVDIARSISDLNSMGVINRDVEESNVVLVRGKIKLIDFNRVIPMLWNEASKAPCYHTNVTTNDRKDIMPPEIIQRGDLTEKIDTYGLGAILFYILTNTRLYHCEGLLGVCDTKNSTLTDEELMMRKYNGTLPTLPIEIEQSTDPAIEIIRETMKSALRSDAGKRPSAQEVSDQLFGVFQSLRDSRNGDLQDDKKPSASTVDDATQTPDISKDCIPTDNNVWNDADDLLVACASWRPERVLSIEAALGHLGPEVVEEARAVSNHIQRKKKIEIGAGPLTESQRRKATLYPTDMPSVNILNATQLASIFPLHSIKAIKAEHVWEHFEYDEALRALQNIRCLLKTNGFARIAVPDAGHPSEEFQVKKVKEGFPDGTFKAGYRNAVYPGHRSLWTEPKFAQVSNMAGLISRPLEWWSPSSKFCRQEYDENTIWIGRTQGHDGRNTEDNPYVYTSLVVDVYPFTSRL